MNPSTPPNTRPVRNPRGEILFFHCWFTADGEPRALLEDQNGNLTFELPWNIRFVDHYTPPKWNEAEYLEQIVITDEKTKGKINLSLEEIRELAGLPPREEKPKFKLGPEEIQDLATREEKRSHLIWHDASNWMPSEPGKIDVKEENAVIQYETTKIDDPQDPHWWLNWITTCHITHWRGTMAPKPIPGLVPLKDQSQHPSVPVETLKNLDPSAKNQETVDQIKRDLNESKPTP